MDLWPEMAATSWSPRPASTRRETASWRRSMEAQALDAGVFQGAVPGGAEFIRSAYFVATGFAEEDQIGIEGAHRIA